ncbi:MAG: cobyric acid synthase [Victivallales bacterium]|nr:cobyric acid synthase [Victivallales bacterium]
MIEHGGNKILMAKQAGCRPEELLDFSVNLHPDGPPEGLLAECLGAFDSIQEYPEPHAESLSSLAAVKWNRPADDFLFGNGSSELLGLVPRALPVQDALIVTPGYLEYENACRAANLPVRTFPLAETEEFQLNPERLAASLQGRELVILGNPNNPTGNTLPANTLRQLAKEHPDTFFLLDEAFADFTGDSSIGNTLPNLLVSRSLTKYYACPGIRIGYLWGFPEIIARIRELQPPWSVSALATHAATFLLTHARQTADGIPALREELANGLRAADLKVYPSQANFLLCRGETGLAAKLLQKRIAVRDCSNYPGLDARFIRVAVRSREDNARLLAALTPKHVRLPKRKTPALMLQGTCSNAGKSVLAAAFCRLLLQDGFSVAPFKAQNMALNSFVTPDGGEIGRAQAVQAAACHLAPDVRMNPILLKPNSDLGSQVVLLGQPIGNFRVRDYFRKKAELWHEVALAYDSLASEHDCIVLEGAGSPGEVNLKRSDIVNMNMARHADATVLLVGDIDRGGVYASFLGTYQTLEPWERSLLHGFLVNKFRGDPSLLTDAHEYILRTTGKPVLGVIDWQRDLGLPEEDSVNFAFTRPVERDSRTLDAALIALGHTANFTDFAPLEIEPDVRLRLVHTAADFGTPDLVLLPGSKNVAADMEVLHQNGLAERLRSYHGFLVGICGGLQLLGLSYEDPSHIESFSQVTECLGILPIRTILRPQKTLRQTHAVLSDGTKIHGYEIHHGESFPTAPIESIFDDSQRTVGFLTSNCFATYLHGVFDEDSFRRSFLDRLRMRMGLPPRNTLSHYGFEEALDRLAEHLRSRIDISSLYRKLNLRS